MQTDPNVDRHVKLIKSTVTDWRSPGGQTFLEMQLLIQAHPSVPVQHMPWVRMPIENAEQLLGQLKTAIEAAQGTFERPPGPMN